MSGADTDSIELMNTNSSELISDLESKYDEEIEYTRIQESSPLPGDPYTTVVLLYILAKGASAGAARGGELIAEDIHDYLHRKYDEWSTDAVDDSREVYSEDLPQKLVVQVIIVDEDGNEVDRYYGFSRDEDPEQSRDSEVGLLNWLKNVIFGR